MRQNAVLSIADSSYADVDLAIHQFVRVRWKHLVQGVQHDLVDVEVRVERSQSSMSGLDCNFEYMAGTFTFGRYEEEKRSQRLENSFEQLANERFQKVTIVNQSKDWFSLCRLYTVKADHQS